MYVKGRWGSRFEASGTTPDSHKLSEHDSSSATRPLTVTSITLGGELTNRGNNGRVHRIQLAQREIVHGGRRIDICGVRVDSALWLAVAHACRRREAPLEGAMRRYGRIIPHGTSRDDARDQRNARRRSQKHPWKRQKGLYGLQTLMSKQMYWSRALGAAKQATASDTCPAVRAGAWETRSVLLRHSRSFRSGRPIGWRLCVFDIDVPTRRRDGDGGSSRCYTSNHSRQCDQCR
ncbi:hypothetical protein C2E23DRAFT_4299 [Lenzites betulinus]|nr:hypothetical protein C2E23DRAFT_4299 [Lenzites betulinus]